MPKRKQESGLTRAGETRIVRDLVVSKRKLKRLECIEIVRTARDRNAQSIGVSSRPFVLCGLPIKRPAKGTLVYIRRNGRYVLRISADAEWGLPFGQDRLIPIWVATLATINKSRLIQFDSAAEILDLFGLPKDGKTYRRLIQGFQRIFGCNIYFGTEVQFESGTLSDMEKQSYFERLRLWYSRKVQERNLPGFQNQVVLSEWFWNELQEHPIPVDLNVVRGLADSPGALDFYIWTCWRCWTAKSPQIIPLFGADGLAQQLGVAGYARNRRFRETLRRWIATTRQLWPDCPAALSKDGNNLTLSHGQAIKRIQS